MRILLSLALVVCLATLGFGQASAVNGQIEGTITDASGAGVPNAEVRITNTQTGLTKTTVTDDSGFYRFTVLPYGTYDVNVTAAGFQPFTRSAIALSAGAVATVNVGVSVGGGNT